MVCYSFPSLHPVLECLVSRGCEDTRGTEIGIATCSRSWPIVATSLRFDVLVSVVAVKTLRGEFLGRLLTMVTTFVKGFHANRCAFTFFFTHTNELTQMHGKDLAGIKVELKELLMDIRRNMGKSNVEQILGSKVRCLEQELPFVDIFHPELSDRNHLLACSEMFGGGVHGYTAIGGVGQRASSIVQLRLTQSMKVKIQHQLDTAMEQFGCAFAAGQLDIAGRVCRTLRFLGDNIDLPMLRDRVSKASQILDHREQSATVRGRVTLTW